LKFDAPRKFDYEAFYASELDKKHKDKSYRYFNNINRVILFTSVLTQLAGEFPNAHTRDPSERVCVWGANDYLGMSRHPVVIEAIHRTVDHYGCGAGGTRNVDSPLPCEC
jgi:5-aminolevulinate synthase